MGTERGFTLIEVVVAMIVLSFGVLGVLQATLLSARLERQSQAVTTGTLLAQERIESIGTLGWDRATAGLVTAPLPTALCRSGAWLQEEVARPGGRFLLIYGLEESSATIPRCTVDCFWESADGGIDPRPVARLWLRRRR